jgi:hypothetical protein
MVWSLFFLYNGVMYDRCVLNILDLLIVIEILAKRFVLYCKDK